MGILESINMGKSMNNITDSNNPLNQGIIGAKPNKGLSLRSRRDRKWVRERDTSWTKELGEESWRRVTRVASRHRTAETPVGMREGPDQWGKTGQDGLAFLVALQKFRLKSTLVLVYICTRGMQCYITPLLHLELTQVFCSLFSFLPLYWLYFL